MEKLTKVQNTPIPEPPWSRLSVIDSDKFTRSINADIPVLTLPAASIYCLGMEYESFALFVYSQSDPTSLIAHQELASLLTGMHLILIWRIEDLNRNMNIESHTLHLKIYTTSSLILFLFTWLFSLVGNLEKDVMGYQEIIGQNLIGALLI